jgi:Ca2+-binding RTX toxin-like protein
VEAASGGDRADHLRGDGGANSLYGGPGRDWLDGRGGNDTVDVGGSTVFVSGESDRRADHIRCGPGLDTVTETDKDVLPSDCDLLAGSEAVPLDEDPIHAQPRPRPGGVEVEALCSGYADRCTRTATLRSGGRILGRSATAASTTSERMWLFVPLNRPLPRGRTIVISVAGSDDYEDEEPRSYAAAWRVRR